MGPGKDPTNHDPADTDTAGLLQLIINCQQFATLGIATKAKLVNFVFLIMCMFMYMYNVQCSTHNVHK